MARTNKFFLEDIRIQSFVTTLHVHPLNRLRGGLSGADCPFSQIEGCTIADGCTDENRCAGSGCCGPPQV